MEMPQREKLYQINVLPHKHTHTKTPHTNEHTAREDFRIILNDGIGVDPKLLPVCQKYFFPYLPPSPPCVLCILSPH